MKLIFSSVFETDFASGVEYLAREADEKIASQWEISVYQTIELLQKNPKLGRIRRDLQPADIRTFGVKHFPRFLIFYTVRGNELVMLRVKHGAMNLHALFGT
ncbi:MAG TPA: type II toxin-antitoxin system RelE/ParE family toxin [Verrucomicrobiae bacterium]|nr:type II toxin-antitoxin system RelE/ParE family toxin [Verrucomicrobiae bacterium]